MAVRPKLTPVQVLERPHLRLEKRIEALQRVKLAGFDMVPTFSGPMVAFPAECAWKMLTSKGSAGVAGAGFVTLAATLASLHQVPVAGLVLLLGVERMTNAARAVVNIIGSCLATIVVAKWEKAFDTKRAGLVLGNSRMNS